MTQHTFTKVSLRGRVTCPHCWTLFPTEDAHWVSESPDLLGDPRLGDQEQLRFLPSRFDVTGHAIDAGNAVCHELACPNCHLGIPRALLEIAPLFVSTVGSPSCGKTYFLAAMIHQLRTALPKRFFLSVADADPQSNKILNDYVERQFFGPDRDHIVRLAKTEEQGDLYTTVSLGQRSVTLPLPFLFTIAPHDQHPSSKADRRVSRVMCLYDNAGESFLPGKDTGQNQVTRHLAKSHVLLFLFDPTQDTRFRDAIRATSKDPQVLEETVTARQETLLHELAQRVRKHAGLRQNDKHDKPLIIVVTKYDAWSKLLEHELLEFPGKAVTNGKWCALDMARIKRVSTRLRELIWSFSPELVSSAEAFSRQVLYMPATAFGRTPERDADNGRLGIRPRDISPLWCEMPILWTLSQRCGGLIPFTRDT